MARRRADKDGRKQAPKNPSRNLRATRGREAPWWAQVAVVVLIIVGLIYAVNIMRQDDDDDDVVVIVPDPVLHNASFEASIAPDTLFILVDRNDTFNLSINNTGDVYCDYDIVDVHSENITVEYDGSASADANHSTVVEILATAGNQTGIQLITFEITLEWANTTTLEWNGTGVNVTDGNETIEILTTNLTIDAFVWVSEFGLRFEALEPLAEAAPGANVSFVFEVENTGTIDEWVGIAATRLNVPVGDRDSWEEPTLDITGTIFLYPGDITHIRVNVTIPLNASPDGDYARILVEGHSLTAEDVEIPLFHQIWLQINVSDYGIRAEVVNNEFIKDVRPGDWVNFTIAVYNYGGTRVNIKYSLDIIPQTWDYNIDPIPDDGWPLLGSKPVYIRIGLSPEEDQLDTELTLRINVFAVDEEAESFVRITARVREPTFAFYAPGQQLQIDMEQIYFAIRNNISALLQFPAIVHNEVLMEYELSLTIALPDGWIGHANPEIVLMEVNGTVEFTMDLTLPLNTTPGQYDVWLSGSAGVTDHSLLFYAVVPEYLNGRYDLIGKPPAFHVPHPSNGTSNATYEIRLNNTGNTAGTFDVRIDNWAEIMGYTNWSAELSHGNSTSNETISVFLDRGERAILVLKVEVGEGFDPGDIRVMIMVTVRAEPSFELELLMIDVIVD